MIHACSSPRPRPAATRPRPSHRRSRRAVLPLTLLAAALPALAPGLSAQSYGDAYPKNPDVDILGYVFELTLSDDTDDILGVTTATARYRADGPGELTLDLVQRSVARDGAGMTVSAVEMDGRALDFRHDGDRLFIDLGRDVDAGERVDVTVRYSGRPADGLRIGPNRYGDRTFFSDNWSSEVRHWLPVVDHPSDKAMTETVVVAPSHYQVSANGSVVEETDLGDGTRRTHYVNAVPTATWLYFIGVARFAVQQVDELDGISIETWVYPQDRDAGFYDFAVPSKQALAYYTDLVGPYVYDRLANVVSAATPGGMEAASTPAYAEASVTGQRTRRWQHVIIHEIAHQWFGNAVTERLWNDVWLSEGFATYYTLLFRRHLYGHDDFIEGLEMSRRTVTDYYADDFDFQIVRDTIPDVDDVSGSMIYQKGAWVLHMLRERLGHAVYDDAIRAYYAEHVNGNAETADLRRHLEEASGEDLEDFFQQWLFQGGIPRLDVRWGTEGDEVVVEMEQSQPRYLFDVDVEVAFRYADGTMSEPSTVQLRPRSGGADRAVLRLATELDVIDLVVDPRTRLLAEWRVTGPRAPGP